MRALIGIGVTSCGGAQYHRIMLSHLRHKLIRAHRYRSRGNNIAGNIASSSTKRLANNV